MAKKVRSFGMDYAVVEKDELNMKVTNDTINTIIQGLSEDMLTEEDYLSGRCEAAFGRLDWGDGKKIGDVELFDVEGSFSVYKQNAEVGDGKYEVELSCPRDNPDTCTVNSIKLTIPYEESRDMIVKC